MIKCKPDTKVYLKLKEKHHVHDLSPPLPRKFIYALKFILEVR